MALSAEAYPAAHRFNRAEYQRMTEAGLFLTERVELLDGVIVTMSPQKSRHAGTVHRLLAVLSRVLARAAYLRVQAPVILSDWSEPEPDIVVCNPDPDDYTKEHPRAHQVHLIIEVADTSLQFDRTEKAHAYAASNIGEYWIVNLIDRSVEVFSAPDTANGRYGHQRTAIAGDALSLPDGQTIAVSEILPPA